MNTRLDNFVHSFARDLVARAGAFSPAVTIPYVASPSASNKSGLWRGTVEETLATDPYTLLAVSGGPGSNWDSLPRMTLQVLTSGTGFDVALNRAQTLFECCLDPDGSGSHPARSRVINGYKAADNASDGHWLIVSIDFLQQPTPIGRDGNRKDRVSFNLQIGFVKKD